MPIPRLGNNMERTADQTNPGTKKPTVKKTASKLEIVIAMLQGLTPPDFLNEFIEFVRSDRGASQGSKE